jgi:positive regulator of sigma E activity
MGEAPSGHDELRAHAPVAAWIVRAAELHRNRWSDEHELAYAIHGTVVGAAVMMAASLHGTLVDILVTVLVTLFVYWVAERYAHLLAAGVRGRQAGWRTTRAAIARVLREGWPMVEAAYLPLVVLIVVDVLSDRLEVAVVASLATSTLLLIALGYLAARRAGASGVGALGWATASGVLGLVTVCLKLLLH